MTTEQLVQNTASWLDWRRGGIGSSDVAAVLNLSPYQTPYELWRIKVGLDEQNVDNLFTYRGSKFEPAARAHFELMNDKDYSAKTFQSQDHPYMRVSLDGWNVEEREVLEIKCPGKSTLEMAKEGKVPAHYAAQIQYQLYVADGKRCFYYPYDVEAKAAYPVIVLPDEAFMADMVPKVINFWKLVQRKQPPALTDEDWHPIPDSMMKLCELWKMEYKMDKRAATKTRERIMTQINKPKMRGFGVKAMWSTKKDGSAQFRLYIEKEGGITSDAPHPHADH